ncbi:uncharacterized protein C12orf71 homolog [Erinaceus europaeus]|uniref:Uncharacterized protein C12orf71 homolog n=1 Tax=Erinaceus europaeus TaxID=9365 RepID=A0ABM3XNZ9_ERIEU|nr:uncharacterized protein C12orf71 homolog [Erinaceus europaeus]
MSKSEKVTADDKTALSSPEEGDVQDAVAQASKDSDHNSSFGSELSLSVGYFPNEDTTPPDSPTSSEDTAAEGAPLYFLPPIQGSWRTTGLGRLSGGGGHAQAGPEQFCKLSISLAWDMDASSTSSNQAAPGDCEGEALWAGKFPHRKAELTLCQLDSLVQKLEMFLEDQKDEEDTVLFGPGPGEDFQEPGSPGLAPTRVPNAVPYQDLPRLSPLHEENATQSRAAPPRLLGGELAEIRQPTPPGNTPGTSCKTRSLPEEDASSSTQAQSCLNLRGVFRRLRQLLLSSLPGRATWSSQRPAEKKRLFHRGIQIQPQESWNQDAV